MTRNTYAVAPVALHDPFSTLSSAETTSDSIPFDAIDAYIEQQMHRLRIPGASLAIVEGDRTVHTRGFGQARPGGETPTPQTPFFIGSLTKSFTALAVMQLVEAGQIDLDAPVQRYLPWFRVADSQASAQITVRHLLNQTSGLPTLAGEIPLADFDNSPNAAERQARALASRALVHPVGAAFEYSNSNYNLLGLIIEAAGGESYAEYVEAHIFSPLGMSHTYTDPAVARPNGLAVGHRYWFAMPFATPNLPVPRGSLAGGLLIAGAEDMAHYLIALLNGGRSRDAQLLSPAGVAELHRGVAEIRAYGLSLGRYGMGWYADELGGTKLLWHSGILPHFFAYMALLPEQRKGVILLINADSHWMSPVLTEMGTGVTALLAGAQPTPTPFSRFIPWALRGLLLIPAFQIADVAATLRLVNRRGAGPQHRPGTSEEWRLHFVFPLILNLLIALTLKPLLSKRRGYLKFYMPDFSLVAVVCGVFSLAWSFLRAGLVIRALRKGSA